MSNKLRLQKPRPAWKQIRRSVERSDEGGARGRHGHGIKWIGIGGCSPRKLVCSLSVVLLLRDMKTGSSSNGVSFFIKREEFWNAASACGTHLNMTDSTSLSCLRGMYVYTLGKSIFIPYMQSYGTYPILLFNWPLFSKPSIFFFFLIRLVNFTLFSLYILRF